MMSNSGKLCWLAFFTLVPGIACGEVSTKVYLRDSNELLVPVEVNIAAQYVDYGPIMVGTELAIVTDSNVAEHWSGRLLIEEDYRDYGVLYARGDFFDGFPESRLEAAGPDAWVMTADDYWEDGEKWVQGFDLDTSYPPDVNTGDWFIIDYNAIGVGDADVALYWQEWVGEPPFAEYIYGLVHCVQFSQVPTRDFDSDGRVDFNDFSIFAIYWYDSNCDEPGSCQGTNLDNYGIVDLNDLMLFTDFWLEKTK